MPLRMNDYTVLTHEISKSAGKGGDCDAFVIGKSQNMQNRIVVFAPHPDDETLGCGGTVAKEASDGNIVHIVFVTDGRNSHKIVLGIQRNPDPEEVKAIRREDTRTVARLLGVGDDNLTFRTSSMAA